MTSQEQEMIQGLIDRVRQTQLPEKDSEAENLLQGSLGRNPDALYILAQTVLVQKYALEQAQKQIADLKSQVDQSRQQAPQPEHHTSFLGSLLGRNDPPPPPPPPQANAQPPYAPVPGYAPQQPSYGAPPPQYGNPAFGAPPSSGSGGFLRSAMQTATGVAAGALAFQGIESLMHGFGGGGGFGSAQGLGGFGGGAPREEIVNNYYGDSDRDRDSGGLSPISRIAAEIAIRAIASPTAQAIRPVTTAPTPIPTVLLTQAPTPAHSIPALMTVPSIRAATTARSTLAATRAPSPNPRICDRTGSWLPET